MPHLSGIISDKTWVHSIREYGMTTTAVVELFSTEWIEINASIWKKNNGKKYTLQVSTGWTMGLCQHC